MDDQHHPDNLLTVPQAAELLAVSKPTVYRLIQQGTLRARTIGPSGPIRIAREDVVNSLVDVEPRGAA